MRTILLTAIFLTLRMFCFSQTYVAFAPSINNQAGSFPEKINLNLEVGRQWDVFSLGIVVGKNSLAKAGVPDTTTFVELRPNLNIFQQGKFTNTFTAGIGYIFNAQESLLTELTYGIEYAYTNQMHLNIYFGQYYFSGRYSDSNSTFFGLSFVYYFTPNNAKSLIQNGKN
jgi:hypothetical protein